MTFMEGYSKEERKLFDEVLLSHNRIGSKRVNTLSHKETVSELYRLHLKKFREWAAVYVSKIEDKAIAWETDEEAAKRQLQEVVSHFQTNQEKTKED